MIETGALTIDRDGLKALFPPLPERTNKGDRGRVLMICGSYDPCGLSMCGAAYFAAKAAYRCGAGIVEIFAPKENYPSLASLVPEAVFSLYGSDEPADIVTKRLASEMEKCDSVVLGCGLGRSELAKKIVETALKKISVPLLIDADGLNILSENESLWALIGEEQRSMTVITPHMGEMSRLTGKSIPEILSEPVRAAMDFAREKGVICLLKDHNTVISDGSVVYINQSGNPGMATAGMGDVLAGIVGSLMAGMKKSLKNVPKSDVLLRVAAGAYLHGCAGDLAAEKIGQYSLMASDVLDKISSVIE
jgi:NAD(P)H-hydrate epimerase